MDYAQESSSSRLTCSYEVIRAIMLEDSLYLLHGLCTHEELIIEVDLHEYGAKPEVTRAI